MSSALFSCRLIILSLLCLLLSCLPLRQHNTEALTPRGDFCVLWYNAENLFHPSDGPPAADDAYTPNGEKHWTRYRYEQKLTCLARIILAAGRGSPPDLVGLGEIEEAMVLEDLVTHPILDRCNYGYVHREGPDHRGMEVACLVRESTLKNLSWKHINPAPLDGTDSTRELLSLSCTTGSGRQVEFIILHFISRYRGSGASAAYRREQARHLSLLMDSLLIHKPGSLVLAGGDFNASPGDWSMEPLLDSLMGKLSPEILPYPASCRGSYKYRGDWALIDYFLVAGAGEDLRIMGRVMALKALLCEDPVYGGVKPERSYEAYSYHGGCSDHLPVILDISW